MIRDKAKNLIIGAAVFFAALTIAFFLLFDGFNRFLMEKILGIGFLEMFMGVILAVRLFIWVHFRNWEGGVDGS